MNLQNYDNFLFTLKLRTVSRIRSYVSDINDKTFKVSTKKNWVKAFSTDVNTSQS
jgi:hypothetical protein